MLVIGAGGAGPARRDRGLERRRADGAGLQVAARQGAHGDGRGRRRRGARQRRPRPTTGSVHFQDTMFGGKYLNNWRMAELHAKEAPDRVRELEQWGARLRPHAGRADVAARVRRPHLQAARPHRRPHRARADPHAAGQGVHQDVDVFMECTITHLLKDGDRVCGAFGYWRATGAFVVFRRAAVVLATGGIGKCYEITSNSWEYTGDGHALALRGRRRARSTWSSSSSTRPGWCGRRASRGLLVTEAVRGEGGILRNASGERSWSATTPKRHGASTATSSRGRSTPRSTRAAARRTAASSSTSRTCRPRRVKKQAARACTTSSWSSPTSTSRRSRWRSARRATTSWAASGSTPRPARARVAGPVRRRRVRGRHARREPARRQLALRPARVRPPRGRAPRPSTPRARRRRAIDDAEVARGRGAR